MWNDDYMKIKVRKTPLLPTSHITHYYFSKQQLPKHSALADICSLQLPETNHSLTLHTQKTSSLCVCEAESWAGGQIPTYCLLFLESTPRAGLRQKCRRSPCVPIPPGHCSAFSAQPAPGCSALPRHLAPRRCSAAQATPLFGKDEETQPCQCLFWPGWVLPGLTEPQTLRECLSRPWKPILAAPSH